MTPLIPAYFAAVFALTLSRQQRVVALLLAFPLFFLLGAARLLVLAFPTKMVGSHLIAIHGFYQFLLGALLIVGAAALSAAKPRTFRAVARPAFLGLLGSGLAALVAGWTLNPLLFWTLSRAETIVQHAGHGYRDPQGALLIMVPYQVGLLVGLCIAWRQAIPWQRVAQAMVALILIQPVILILAGEWAQHTATAPHVAVLRALAVLVVLLLAIWVLRPDRRRRGLRSEILDPELQHG